MRNLMMAIATAAVMATSVPALAATTNVGVLTALGSTGYDTPVTYSAGSFSDSFTFSTTGGTNIFSVLAVKNSLTTASLLDPFTAVLTSLGGLTTYLTYSTAINSATNSFSQSLYYTGNIAADTYTLTLSGGANNASSFSLLMSASSLSPDITTPVPEPETYAMMLAGLGLIGAVVRRRNKAKQDA
ncbi:PEP-CTERM protein-sorting domain-containing protein [Rhodoferax sp. OV413]|uniref:FxDxF family PEP-CTERM protein n=1 Tax=Rhodoferax sp. OV413 TaxID=1855285 RepID=UPI00088DEE36|nr:FxDxF family PEP-CTERM protein [Rhodoferax sp. OV413]SDP79048.1 PEP-CTERM protein-sorting domain-containing protein [Rhodoferax sp. OV413]